MASMLLRIAGLLVVMSLMQVLLVGWCGVTTRRYARRLPHGFRRQGRPREGPPATSAPLDPGNRYRRRTRCRQTRRPGGAVGQTRGHALAMSLQPRAGTAYLGWYRGANLGCP